MIAGYSTSVPCPGPCDRCGSVIRGCGDMTPTELCYQCISGGRTPRPLPSRAVQAMAALAMALEPGAPGRQMGRAS